MGWATPDFSPELVSAEKITYNFVLWELVSGAEITSFVPRNWFRAWKLPSSCTQELGWRTKMKKLRDFFVFICVFAF